MDGKRVVRIGVCGFLLTVAALPARSQAPQDSMRTTTVIAGDYSAGGLSRFFFGTHYRELWKTPVKVEVLDLENFAGGLTPLRRGGGMQTLNLRFQGKNGLEYVFRSINKDPSKILPAELRETLARNIFQDQISSSHPFSALVVAPLAEAAGVLHTEPHLIFLPDDPRLGQFQADFRNVLGFIEERANDGPDGEPGFAGSDKIIGTDELFVELEEDHDNAVDAEAFLTARLLDIFVGDWDRHTDQWRWARFKKDGKKLWYPIPRDRDQAFVKFDGLLPAFTDKRFVVLQLEGFNKKAPDVVSLTFSGRYLDRRFLPDLEYQRWQKITEAFLAKLTDAVIVQAVKKLPPEIYAKSGEELSKKLLDRRAVMRKASDQYYRHIVKYVDVKTSHESEWAEISRRNNGDVEIAIYARDKNSGEKSGEPFYRRLFKKGETKEIRLYLLGGNDRAVLQGESGGITVRLIGGLGEDELVDNSKASNYFYDVKNGTKFVAGPQTKIRAGKIDSVVNFYENTPPIPDYGRMAMPLPFFGYNVDDGLFIGGGPMIFKYEFRKKPFASQTIALANYAFKTGAFRIRYSGLFIDFLPSIHLYLEAQATVPKAVKNFYGFGNATVRDDSLDEEDFYRVKFNDYHLRPTFYWYLSRQTRAGLGVAYRYSDVQLRDTSFVKSARPYGVEVASLFEIASELQYDSRNNARVPTSGLFGRLNFAVVPRMFDNEEAFTKLRADLRTYVGNKTVTLALRAAGERVWGRAPFYEAAFLGGSESLRGFRFQRFAGEAAAWGNAELRFALTRFFLLVPTDLGVFGFADAGRVWVDGDSEGAWHKNFGGGISLAPVRRDFTFSIGAGVSNERTAVVAGLGFGF
jgi:hypothetical protein